MTTLLKVWLITSDNQKSRHHQTKHNETLILMEINKIYNEENLRTMSRMPDDYIDLTVTSPPYDNLRLYTGEAKWNEDEWMATIKELYRVTKQGGVVVWVIGDATINGSETLTSFKQALWAKECGFRQHDTMIYKKYSPSFPEKTRYGQVFEYMFVWSKGKPKTINLIRDRKNKWGGQTSFGRASERERDGSLTRKGKIKVKDIGVRFNVWEIANGRGFGSKDEITWQHPATFPEQLALDHIRNWSNEGNLVYDPFMGSGTTAKVAFLSGRNYIGSEISAEYCKIAKTRLAQYPTLRLV